MSDRELPFSSVVVAGLAVPVRLSKGLDGAGRCGMAGIELLPQSQAETAKRLCHEVAEAWNYEYELKLPHNKITALENALFELIRQREVVRWIQRGRW